MNKPLTKDDGYDRQGIFLFRPVAESVWTCRGRLVENYRREWEKE